MTFVTAGRAKSEVRLTEDDLARLSCPAPMRLYELADVVAAAERKADEAKPRRWFLAAVATVPQRRRSVAHRYVQ